VGVTEQEGHEPEGGETGVSYELSCRSEDTMTYSSLRKANDQPSVRFAISPAIASSSVRANRFSTSLAETLAFLIHLNANCFLKGSLGRVKSYLTSNLDGRLRIASSMRSGWFVVAMVKTPWFCTRPSSSLRKKDFICWVTIESMSSMMRIHGAS
jgi:hypothetical protein